MLRFEITGLWYPDGDGGFDPIGDYARLGNCTDGQVVVPINGQRTADVSISIEDSAELLARAYAYMLRVFYLDEPEPVMWGAITNVKRARTSGRVIISAADRATSLYAHFLRRGDEALNNSTDPDLPNEWNRQVPINGAGLQMLVDAAQNLPGHQADNYPPLGIAYDYDDTDALADDTNLKVKFSRGDRVWDSAGQLTPQQASSELGQPDFELAPVASVPGVYANLNVFQRQGDYDPLRDRHHDTPLQIHCGWGKDNADVDEAEGGKIVTHAHVLSEDGRTRVTRTDVNAAEDYGVYVDWDRTPFSAGAVQALQIRGDNTLAIFRRPTPELEVTPRRGWDYRFLRDYMVGTPVHVVERDALERNEYDARITQVTLKQTDQAGNTAELLKVLPTITSFTDPENEGF